MKPKLHPPLRCAAIMAVLSVLASGPTMHAQAAAAPANPAGSSLSTTEETIVLSPFEVNAAQDIGYKAGNTLSGSRLNTALKDTSAPISVFTPEFLSDFGLTNIEDMMVYSTNFEKDFEDSNAGFNAPTQRGSGASTPDFRMRGLTGSFAVDMVESRVPQDSFNIDRVEVSSGPNSVLFGLGQAGGTVSLTTKIANVRRDRGRVKGTFGTWNLHRVELDWNKVLIKDKLGFRLNALDTHNNTWRTYDFAKSRRVAAALTYQPFEHTTMHVAWDAGNHGRHTDWSWPSGDGLHGWVTAGRPVVNIATTPFNATTFAPLGINRVDTAVHWTFMDNTTSNPVVNLQNQLQSYTGVNAGGTAYATDSILTPYSPPAYQSFSGPGSILHGFFRDYSAKVEQRWGKLVVEGAFIYTYNKSIANGWAVPGNSINLRGDPNATLPVPGSTTPAANASAGKLYLENTWRPEDTDYSNEVYRLTAAYELDLGKWFGRHKLAGLAETGKIDSKRHVYQEILVNQNNVPINNVGTPEHATNQLYRRHYATEGAYDTYYMSDPRLLVPSFTVGANTYAVRRVGNGQAGQSEDLKLTDTMMIADQVYFWKDRIIGTVGYRTDKVKFKNGMTARISPTDPSVLSGGKVANEWAEVPGQFDHSSFKPHTFNVGVVVHPSSRFSAFYNESNNVGAPSFTARILPEIAPPINVAPLMTKGKSRDYGIMIDLYGGDYFLRLTRFDTVYLNNTPIQPGNNPFQAAQGLGQGLDALVAAGRITTDQALPYRVNPTAFSIDVMSAGYELELNANPNKNISVRATFSYSDRNRENFAKEVDPFKDKLYAFLATVDSTGVLSGFGNQSPADPTRTAKQMIFDEIDTWYDLTETNQLQSFASRPYKFTMNGRYKFTEGRLKGLVVGGGVRWASDNYMQKDVRLTVPPSTLPNPDFGKEYYGHTEESWDFFTNYRTKLAFLGNKNVTFQLNVRNAFNQGRVLPAKFSNDFSGLRRVYVNAPRSFRFSIEIEF